MDPLTLIFRILLFSGLVLFAAGLVLFFVPQILVKWNAVGNIWIGDPESAKKYGTATKRLFSADYAIFSNHRMIGGIMWGISSVFLIVYILYR